MDVALIVSPRQRTINKQINDDDDDDDVVRRVVYRPTDAFLSSVIVRTLFHLMSGCALHWNNRRDAVNSRALWTYRLSNSC